MMKQNKRETSPRFAKVTRDVIARAPMLVARPASEHEPTDYSGYNLKRVTWCPAGKRTNTFRKRGGLSGGPASHLGTVPQAFFR